MTHVDKSMLQYISVWRSVLQCVAVCCSVLQCDDVITHVDGAAVALSATQGCVSHSHVPPPPTSTSPPCLKTPPPVADAAGAC